MAIPEIAASLIETTLSHQDVDNARTIFVVGGKQSGKSTLLNICLDKSETPRETLVLEYSFARKSNQKQALEKTICHLWEYGGKLEGLKSILSCIPMKRKSCICIMVDLSKIKGIWDTVETCIQSIIDSYPYNDMSELLIIGNKYDIFKNYDSDTKKFVCITLRSLALLYKAHLFFHSSKESNLTKRSKELLQSFGFGNEIELKEKNTNPAKPLSIQKNSDSWENIGIAPLTIEQLKVRHLSRIPPEPVDPTVSDNNLQRNISQAHPEPVLDKLVAFKYEELRNIETIDLSIDEYLHSIKAIV